MIPSGDSYTEFRAIELAADLSLTNRCRVNFQNECRQFFYNIMTFLNNHGDIIQIKNKTC